MTITPFAEPSVAPRSMLETELTTRSMGGGLRILVASTLAEGDGAERDLRRVAGRIETWARRLSRFSSTSDLGVLNADPGRSPVSVGPTIAAAMRHARCMTAATEGAVDIGLLDARIAAETDERLPAVTRPSWQLVDNGSLLQLVREGRVRFDLDGVAKGWIADRALRLLDGYPSALIDADGDVAARAGWSAGWGIAVEHPQDDGVELARLRIPRDCSTDRYGVATSGTSVHRWRRSDGPTHHLIDPRTERPALTDVVQATVVAGTTGVAEALAKAAVIRGSRDGLELLGRAGAWAALLLLEDGDLLATPGTARWLD